uniref:Type II secretion system protein L n=1 Tax=Candidatus Kentrum sp. LFY TaxID=2126342 RepID=A0A450UD58_9GAMM|nr:MAG: general secretion pathway protein L [Candidatus Kentron sp. LFY]
MPCRFEHKFRQLSTMNELFIRLDDKPEVTWLRQGEVSGDTASRTGPLPDPSGHADCHVIVFVPGSDVVLLMADVPPMTRQRMSTAVSFALEDHLIADVDLLHFALGRRSGSEPLPVAVVADGLMSAWLSRLEEAGIYPEFLIPETLALPLAPDTWTVFMDADGALIRSGALSGLAVDLPNLAIMLRSALDNAPDSALDSALDTGENPPKRIRLLHCGEGAAMDIPPLGPGCEVTEEVCRADRLQLLAAHFDEQRAINLLQGKYNRETDVRQTWRAWRVPFALVVIWFAIWVAGALFDVARLSERSRILGEEMETVYRQVFPEARNMTNLRVRMKRGLDALRGTGARETVGFLELLGRVGVHLQDARNIRLVNLDFRSERLELRMEMDDLQAFDGIKARLVGEGLVVEVLSVTSRESTVMAHLRITPGEASPRAGVA